MTAMGLNGVKVGLAIGGSHCNMSRAISTMEELVEAGADLTPIMSGALMRDSTRFGTPDDWWSEVMRVTGKEPLTSIPEVEPSGPEHWFDVLLVMPCTGNTMAKIANAINDSATTMAVKAQLRNGNPVVLAITTNDALGMNAMNLGRLLACRNIYFVPFGQDNPAYKPRSLDAHLELVIPTLECALRHEQIQPILQEWRRG
jgi:dipicolinate synthase subunit B